MTAGHTQPMPEFVLDRSLGRRQVPDLLRGSGLVVHPLAEVFGVPADESVDDRVWLERVGAERWVVLMKDERIRYRPAERAALLDHGVRAFCLTNGNLPARAMAEHFLASLDRSDPACSHPAPYLNAVNARGLRGIGLDA